MKIMQNALLRAIKESMGIVLETNNSIFQSPFASKITLDKKAFIIVVNDELLKKFALDFLGTQEVDNDTLMDISKEIANLIVGKAKVLYEQEGRILKLGIPQFIGDEKITNYIDVISYNFENLRCIIYEVENG
ncbi:MAG: chemotaxis protein CheX [Helicobacteraceae bacterium]|nr:chemotaxis protein CheX [Helicobacteraceae bacterium]